MLAVLAAIIAFLLGTHLGATWPWLAFWVRRRILHREPVMPRTREETRLLVLTWMLVIVMAFGFVTGLLLIATRAAVSTSNEDLRDYQTCQAAYSTDFRDAYQARADASIKVTKALDDVIKAVADEDPAAFRKAVRHYLDVRAEQVKERAENPLPPLPDKVCGPAPKES